MSASLHTCNLTSRGLVIKPSSHDQHTRPRSSLFANPGSDLNPVHFLGHQSQIHLSQKVQTKNQSKRNFAVFNSSQPSGIPQPSGPPSSGSLKGWIIGIGLTVVLPFLVHKYGKKFLGLENKFDAIVEKVEDVVEEVEKAAEKVEKMAEDVADRLPEGELKKAVIFVEKVADRIDVTAEIADKHIDKFQEVEEKVESAVESELKKKVEVPGVAKEPANKQKIK